MKYAFSINIFKQFPFFSYKTQRFTYFIFFITLPLTEVFRTFILNLYRYHFDISLLPLRPPVSDTRGNKRKETIMPKKEAYPEVDQILQSYQSNPTSIISILQDVQKHYRYLPADVLTYVAKKLGLSEAKVYSVATFYDNFSLEPKGKYLIKVCDGTACHVRKSAPILAALRKDLGLSEEKHTTDDMKFTVDIVSCLGACGLAPVLTVNDKVYPAMTPEKTAALLKELKEEK